VTDSLFVDSSVLLHALGGPSPAREACVALVAAAGEARCTLHVSVEAVQEVVFHRMRRVPVSRAVEAGRRLSETAVVHPFDLDILRRSLLLVETCRIRGRDAVHAATAMAHGFDAVVTLDRDFEAVPGLGVVRPQDAVQRLAP